MYRVTVEANGSDHRGHSYNVLVMKTGRLITCNTKQICSTTISSERYMHEQMKKAAGLHGDIFMQTILLSQAGYAHHVQHTMEQRQCIVGIPSIRKQRKRTVLPLPNRVARLAAGLKVVKIHRLHCDVR